MPRLPGLVRTFGIVALFLAAAVAGTASGALFAFVGDLPQISALDDYSPGTITRVVARDGSPVGEFATERRTLVTYDQIPPVLRHALVAAEDGAFFRHSGIDLKRIMATLVRRALRLQRYGGASTITQQLARKLFLTDEQTPEPARRVLASVLNYVLDLLDIFPDQYQGLGVADDAILLRLGARQAVTAGASQGALRELAKEAADVETVLGDLAAQLEKYLDQLAGRAVRGRTVSQILSDKVVFGSFANDVQRQVATYKAKPIDATLSADYHVGELKRMVRSSLKKAGLVA